ncbi:MAG: hypothetical protein H7A23_17075 [Leptospiraceae bacterium]|nr:hypothetical protein [Leptospiraceae bacterium]MCP5496260.1 hypothetical protein [Leptospiraceae bacterium]
MTNYSFQKLENTISQVLCFGPSDSKKMERAIHDIALHISMGKTEVADFVLYNAEKEIEKLKESNNWKSFKRNIIQRLSPGRVNEN